MITSYFVRVAINGVRFDYHVRPDYRTDFRLVRMWPRFWKKSYQVVDLNPKACERALYLARECVEVLVKRGHTVLLYEQRDVTHNVLIGVNLKCLTKE